MMRWLLPSLVLVPLAAQANVDVALYGQVNKGIFGYDDGVSRETVVVDNDFSSTRFGLKGKQKLDGGLTVGFLLEGEMEDNPSNGFTQQTAGTLPSTPVNTANALLVGRHANVGLSSGWGAVYLGKLSTAVDGVLTQDLVGAQDVMSAEYRRAGGGLRFRKTTGGFTTYNINGLTEGQANSRNNGVRYESPVMRGFQLKVAGAQEGDMDAALYYAGAFGDFEAEAGLGVFFNNDATIGTNTVDSKVLGSASVKHASGLAGTVAASKGNLENGTAGADAPQSLYLKTGYAWADYEVAADWGKSEHFNSAVLDSDRLNAYGLAAQYKVVDGVTVAGLFRVFNADVTGDVTEDIKLYGVTMKVKF